MSRASLCYKKKTNPNPALDVYRFITQLLFLSRIRGMSSTKLTQCTVYWGIPNVTLWNFFFFFFFVAEGPLREWRRILTGVTPQSCLGLELHHTGPTPRWFILPTSTRSRGFTTLTLVTCLRGEQTSCSQPAPTSRCQDESCGNLTSGALRQACRNAVPPKPHGRLSWLKHCHDQHQLQTETDILFPPPPTVIFRSNILGGGITC